MKLNTKNNIRLLGKVRAKPISIPTNKAIPRVDFGNCILEMRSSKNWKKYFAYGLVLKICKGDDFDLIIVDFGRGGDNACKVYCRALNTRKQVYSLKVGQYAMFGLIRKTSDAYNKLDRYLAEWCMGIYVPKIVDIRNSELNTEELENEEITVGASFLDNFFKTE